MLWLEICPQKLRVQRSTTPPSLFQSSVRSKLIQGTAPTALITSYFVDAERSNSILRHTQRLSCPSVIFSMLMSVLLWICPCLACLRTPNAGCLAQIADAHTAITTRGLRVTAQLFGASAMPDSARGHVGGTIAPSWIAPPPLQHCKRAADGTS